MTRHMRRIGPSESNFPRCGLARAFHIALIFVQDGNRKITRCVSPPPGECLPSAPMTTSERGWADLLTHQIEIREAANRQDIPCSQAPAGMERAVKGQLLLHAALILCLLPARARTGRDSPGPHPKNGARAPGRPGSITKITHVRMHHIIACHHDSENDEGYITFSIFTAVPRFSSV